MSQGRKIIDKSGKGRKASGGRTRADPQSKEPSNRTSGLLDGGRKPMSRAMSTARSVRNLKNVPARKR